MENNYSVFNLRLTENEIKKLEEIKKMKKFKSFSEVFRFLLQQKFSSDDSMQSKELCTLLESDNFFELHKEFMEKVGKEKLGFNLLYFYGKNCKLPRKSGLRRKPYKIYTNDAKRIKEIKECIALKYNLFLSDTDFFRVLLLHTHIMNELTQEESILYLEQFKQRLDNMLFDYYDAKMSCFIEEIIKKYSDRGSVVEHFEWVLSCIEQLNEMSAYIDDVINAIKRNGVNNKRTIEKIAEDNKE